MRSPARPEHPPRTSVGPRFRLAFVACSVVGFGGAAWAQPAFEPIRLVYRAAPGCPSEDDFVARVRRAAPRVTLTSSDDATRIFTVTVGESGGKRGRLRIDGSSGAPGSRGVVGVGCAEVADILAFAVALAVDPALAGHAASATTATGPSSPPTTSVPAPATPSVTPPSAAPVAVLAQSSAIDSDAGRQTPLPEGGRWAAAIDAFAASADAPKVTVGGGASIERRWRTGSLAPSLHLGAAFGSSEPVDADAAKVTFWSALLIAEACPTEWGAGGFSFRPCARVEVGARTAEGHDIPGGQNVTRPWAALAPAVHLRQRLARRLFLDLGGDVLFPLIRDRVYLAPDITVDQVPMVGVGTELGLGVEFL